MPTLSILEGILSKDVWSYLVKPVSLAHDRLVHTLLLQSCRSATANFTRLKNRRESRLGMDIQPGTNLSMVVVIVVDSENGRSLVTLMSTNRLNLENSPAQRQLNVLQLI